MSQIITIAQSHRLENTESALHGLGALSGSVLVWARGPLERPPHHV
jgi:hypothetical protein